MRISTIKMLDFSKLINPRLKHLSGNVWLTSKSNIPACRTQISTYVSCIQVHSPYAYTSTGRLRCYLVLSHLFSWIFISVVWLTQGFVFLSLNNLSFRVIFLFGKLSPLPGTVMSVISEGCSSLLQKCALGCTRLSSFYA